MNDLNNNKNGKMEVNDEINIDSFDKDNTNEIQTLDDLITVAKSLGRKRKRNSDYNKLKELLPELEELNNMIGMKDIKLALTGQILFYLQELGNNDMLHTVIQGMSGTGKTKLAKIISKIYLKLGFLENDTFIIAKRSDLIGEYLGQTAVKTQKKINEAKGGVLFIDEAYSLGNNCNRDSYSKECIDTLVSNLEENRDFVCIIAGYKNDLQKCFFDKNQGLERRFPWRFSIENYNYEELFQIFKRQLKEAKWEIQDDSIGIDFFKDKMNFFDKMGGDTEILLAKCKIVHSKRVFGKPRFLKKILNKNDLLEGFNIYKLYSDKIIKDKLPLSMYL